MGMNKPVLEEAPRAVAERRHLMFRETPVETMQRWVLGTAWALRPCRISGLPTLGRMWLAEMRTPPAGLPSPDDALDNPRGLCGFVHDLSVPTLVAAHRRGLFTFAHFGPLKWMAPPQRGVLDFADFHMPKRLRSRRRPNPFRLTIDRNF